jgi:DNA-binding transcriptional regulator YiaG
MAVAEEKRRRARELVQDLAIEAQKHREFEVRLRLLTPSVLSQEVVTNLRKSLGISQFQMAVDLGVHNGTYEKWERGLGTPHFASVVLLLVAELILLSTTVPFDNSEYDPKHGLLGQILSSGVMEREQVVHAFERLGEVMLMEAPKTMKEAADGQG